jgi:hypothetical protein
MGVINKSYYDCIINPSEKDCDRLRNEMLGQKISNADFLKLK